MIDGKTKLDELRDKAGTMAGPFETELGKEWGPRAKRMETYYKEKSADWDDLWKLYAKTYREIAFSDGSKAVIKDALAKTIVKNWIADLWATIPDPQLRSRRSRQNPNFDRALCDLATAVHDVAGTDQQFKRGLTVAAYQGGFVIWPVFEQRGQFVQLASENVPPLPQDGEETAEPTGVQDEAGEPQQAPQTFVADAQRVRNQMVPLSLMRFDPNGREPDLYDDQYIGRIYTRKLSEWWADERIDLNQRKMLVNAISASDRRGLTTQPSNSVERQVETDPDFIDVKCLEIWSRPSKKIIHIPIISGEYANFEIGPFDWPTTYAKADFGRGKMPCRLIMADWNPPDKDDSDGRYPLPLLRDIRGLLEDRIRLYNLFFEAARSVIDKYFTIDGITTAAALTKAMSSDQKEIVFLDRDKVQSALNVTNLGGIDFSKLIRRFETSDKQLQALNFSAMIDRVETQIYENVGQGPADRGGITKAESATATMNIRAKMDIRTGDQSEQIADAYDDVTELDFMLLAEHGTLPIPYMKTSDNLDQSVWDEFEPELLEGEDFSFSHVRGSSRPQNKQGQKIERKDFLATAGPFLANDPQKLNSILSWVLEAYDFPDVKAMLANPIKDLLKQLFAIDVFLGDHPEEAANNKIAAQKQEIVSQLEKAGLSQSDMTQIVMAASGKTGAAPEGGAVGTGPKSLTPGQQAAGAGAAGQTNVM